MKSLLAALKTELTEAGIASSVAVVADENALPPEVKFPFIGLKDGTVEREEGHSETLTERLTVAIVVWTAVLKPEASIMGEGDAKGVLDLVADVHGVLNENLLGLPGMEYAFCAREEASELWEMEDAFVQKKKCIYVYERTT